MHQVLRAIVEPGFFANSSVQLAAAVGAVVAIVAGLRRRVHRDPRPVVRGRGARRPRRRRRLERLPRGGQRRCGDSSAITVTAAGIMELIGIQRARGRDLATGIVLGAGFGLAALFLYLGTTYDNTTGATVTILFGSPFTLSTSVLPLVAVFGALALGIVADSLPAAPAGVGEPRPRLRAPAPGPADRRALPARDGARGGPVGGHDRGDPVDRAARRSGGHRAPAHPAPRPRDPHRRAGRDRRHVARDPARLRQLLLAAAAPRLAGQLLRGHDRAGGVRGRADDLHADRLPADCDPRPPR